MEGDKENKEGNIWKWRVKAEDDESNINAEFNFPLKISKV